MSEWYYGQGGQQEGPIDEATMRSRIAAGQVGPADLVWREGMAEWLPLAQVSELSQATAQTSAETSPYATPGTNPVSAAPHQYYTPTLPTSGLAIASMVCGILAIIASCVYIGIVFGIPAVICGHMAMKSFKVPQPQVGGKGMALAGLICGYIGSAFTLIVGGFFAVMILIASNSERGSTIQYHDSTSAEEETWDATYESTGDGNTKKNYE